MEQIEVTPAELRSVGSEIARGGPEIEALQGELRGLASGVSEPTATASALENLATQWASGIARLAEDVEALGLFTEAVAGVYETTDRRSMGGEG